MVLFQDDIAMLYIFVPSTTSFQLFQNFSLNALSADNSILNVVFFAGEYPGIAAAGRDDREKKSIKSSEDELLAEGTKAGLVPC